MFDTKVESAIYTALVVACATPLINAILGGPEWLGSAEKMDDTMKLVVGGLLGAGVVGFGAAAVRSDVEARGSRHKTNFD